jgi:hypothetical protein
MLSPPLAIKRSLQPQCRQKAKKFSANNANANGTNIGLYVRLLTCVSETQLKLPFYFPLDIIVSCDIGIAFPKDDTISIYPLILSYCDGIIAFLERISQFEPIAIFVYCQADGAGHACDAGNL